MQNSTPTVLVPVADGTEEIEAVTVIDVLRRAGAKVTVASVGPLQITASRGVKLVADQQLDDCKDTVFDLIVLPGGVPGAEHLGDSETLKDMLDRQHRAGRPYAAICAAPALVLEPHGLLSGRRATCHPAFEDRLTNREYVASRVVTDGPVTTSRGPGTALEFALELVARLFGPEKAEAVAAPMIVR